jgi:diketogulonate reductase-like aldo/keto reductase
VLIRWHIQLGNIVIPKSVNSSRIASNLDVFDFELSANEMASIASLDTTEAGLVPTHDLHRQVNDVDWRVGRHGSLNSSQ